MTRHRHKSWRDEHSRLIAWELANLFREECVVEELFERILAVLLQPPTRSSGFQFIVGNEEVFMSQNLKQSQTATIVAAFTDTTVNPPVARPLGSLPVFSNPEGNLILTPDPAAQPTDSSFKCSAVWGPNAVAGQTATVNCHAEGDPTPGVDPIDCPPLSFMLLAPEDNAGSMTATVA